MDERDYIALCYFHFFFFVIYFLSWDRYGNRDVAFSLVGSRVQVKFISPFKRFD